MQLGVHVIGKSALATACERGVDVQRAIGVIDLLRLLEGLEAEPGAGRPLTVGGLDELLAATASDTEAAMRWVRTQLREARHYFDRHRIPICFVVSGTLCGDLADGSVSLEERSLSPLFGKGFKALDEAGSTSAWWWAPHVG